MHPVNRLLSLLGIGLSRTGNNGSTLKSNSPYVKNSYGWLNHVLFPNVLEEGGRALRPHYTWGVIQGAHMAKELGINRISVIEFGVAGGNGLVSLEKIAKKIEAIYEINIDVYGFDTGNGLPAPTDFRDEPHVYVAGHFKMDVEKLEKRLSKAKLILGPIDRTIIDFMESSPAPVAFVSIDVDLYSSSMHALRLLDSEEELLLPRIYFYFDDIMGPTKNEYAGERLAISEFNASHPRKKITPIYGLKYHLPIPFNQNVWAEKVFMAHSFDHNLYGRYTKLTPASDLSLSDQ